MHLRSSEIAIALLAGLGLAGIASGQELVVTQSGNSVVLAPFQGQQGGIHIREDGVDVGFFIHNLAQWFIFPATLLALDPPVSGDPVQIGTLSGQSVFVSTDLTQRYVTDLGGNGLFASHIWHVSSPDNEDRLMVLSATDQGDLSIGGQLTQNAMFGLAESFWEAEPIEPGELVAIDPSQPGAVRRTRDAYERGVIGVASGRPAIVLGGGAFSRDALRRTWGEEIAAEFERSRPALELRAYADHPSLLAEAGRLESPFSLETHPRAASELRPERPRIEPSPEQLTESHAAARERHEARLFDATIDLFFSERFAAVAMAGRTEVKADASFGVISPGDLLTASPDPGVAMKATAAGPIVGTALEALSSGTGSITMLVHRGWFGGEEGARGGVALASDTGGDAKGREIADLRRRLAALEERLNRLESPTLRTAAEGQAPTSGR